ncbi:hypothetical protein V8G54_022559, partial [Vigna mungo]
MPTKRVTFSARGVLITPGATQLLLILSLAHSHARFFVIWCIAPFAALYTTGVMFEAITPAAEDMKTILAASEAFRRGCASWLKWKQDSRFVLITNAKSSAVKSRVGFCT